MSTNILKKNNVHVQGNPLAKQTIIFSHGYGSDQSSWRFVLPAFKKKYRLVLYDLTGCGESDFSEYNPEKYNNLNAFADDLIEICDELNLKNVILAAHSVSSIIGTLAANKRSDLFFRMIFLGASPYFLSDGDYIGGFNLEGINEMLKAMDLNYSSWAQGFSPYAMNAPAFPNLSKEFFISLTTMRPDISLNIARIIFLSDHRADIAKLTVPVQIVQMSSDPFVPEGVGRYLQQTIQNNEYHILDCESHFPHMSNPQDVINFISNYLEPLP